MTGTWKASAAWFALLTLSCAAGTPPPPRTRAEFARALDSVRVGMTRAQVRAALGEPDDVVTQLDPSHFAIGAGCEVWCYGSEGHLAYPSLGRVCFDRDGVPWLNHGEPRSPFEPLPPEPELRELLRKIDAVAGVRASPLRLVQAANALVRRGREQTLAVLREYGRVGGPWSSRDDLGVLLLVRILFEVPDPPGFQPLPRIGALDPAAPKDARRVPRFPLTIVDDVPIDLLIGRVLGGVPEPFDMHLETLAAVCRFRERPLAPGDRPWEILEKLRATPDWLYGKDYERKSEGHLHPSSDERGAEHIRRQLVELLATVSRPDADVQPGFEDRWITAHWDAMVAELERAGIRWDPSRDVYVFADGTVLPEEKPVAGGRLHWEPASLAPCRLSLVLERRNRGWVDLDYRIAEEEHPPFWRRLFGQKPRRPEPIGVRVLDSEDGGRELDRLDLRLESAWTMGGTSFRLPEGRGVRLDVEYRGEVERSSEFTP